MAGFREFAVLWRVVFKGGFKGFRFCTERVGSKLQQFFWFGFGFRGMAGQGVPLNPYTLNPKPETLNPKPQTLNPRP